MIKYVFSCIRFIYQLFLGFTRRRKGLIFICGLPKSGTTWIENTLKDYTDGVTVMPPLAIWHEQFRSSGFKYRPSSFLLRVLNNGNFIMKLHIDGDDQFTKRLTAIGLKTLVIHRDIRDVSISYYYYVKRTWHHFDYSALKDLSVEQGIDYFFQNRYDEYKQWIASWSNQTSDDVILLQYEDLLEDLEKCLKKFLIVLDQHIDEEKLKRAVLTNSFITKSKGRTNGEANNNSFVRRGIVAEWKTVFSEEQKRKFML